MFMARGGFDHNMVEIPISFPKLFPAGAGLPPQRISPASRLLHRSPFKRHWGSFGFKVRQAQSSKTFNDQFGRGYQRLGKYGR
jgi:hypothetical protein